MSDDTATIEFSAEAKSLGDKIAELTLKQAKELSEYLKEEHKIEAAAGGVVMQGGGGGGGGGGEEAEAKTEFDVVLTGFGDKKLDVVKVVNPATLKEGASKEDCDDIKEKVEAAGGSIELK